jgi:hypothetical protein
MKGLGFDLTSSRKAFDPSILLGLKIPHSQAQWHTLLIPASGRQ